MSFTILFNTLFGYLRTIFFALSASSATIGTGLITYHIIYNNSMYFEKIVLPSSLEELGYTPHIFTNRIIEDIKYLNNRTYSSKERVLISQYNIDLDNSTSLVGFSYKDIITYIANFFGKEIRRISGEIITIKNSDKIFYKVKIRESPSNISLVDFESDMPPEQLIRQISLQLLEKIDPLIAATLYQGIYRDTTRAFYLIDSVLSYDSIQAQTSAYNLRSLIYIDQEYYELALLNLNKALKLNENNYGTHANLSTYYRRKGENVKALEEAELSIKLNPNAPLGYFSKGLIYRNTGEYDKASEQLIVSIQKDKHYYPSYNYLAAVFSAQKKFDEAIYWILKGINTHPESPYLYYNYSLILSQIGREKEALFQIQKALDIDSSNSEFLISLCDLYNQLKMYPERDSVRNKLRRNFESGMYIYPAYSQRAVAKFLR